MLSAWAPEAGRLHRYRHAAGPLDSGSYVEYEPGQGAGEPSRGAGKAECELSVRLYSCSDSRQAHYLRPGLTVSLSLQVHGALILCT